MSCFGWWSRVPWGFRRAAIPVLRMRPSSPASTQTTVWTATSALVEPASRSTRDSVWRMATAPMTTSAQESYASRSRRASAVGPAMRGVVPKRTALRTRASIGAQTSPASRRLIVRLRNKSASSCPRMVGSVVGWGIVRRAIRATPPEKGSCRPRAREGSSASMSMAVGQLARVSVPRLTGVNAIRMRRVIPSLRVKEYASTWSGSPACVPTMASSRCATNRRCVLASTRVFNYVASGATTVPTVTCAITISGPVRPTLAPVWLPVRPTMIVPSSSTSTD
jgi:hypothetical protein